MGRAFLICTDHFSLKFLLDQRLSTIPQHQWASRFLGFDFRVEYKPGATNVVADTLSRRDIEAQATTFAILAPSFKLFDELRAESTLDPTMVALWQDVRDDLCDNN
jgi:hypothetical protein